LALITAIAYDTERNLGRAYNEIMDRLLPGDWCCFLDHDAMFTTRNWYRQLLAAIENNPAAGLFAAVTNRIGRKSQIPTGAPSGHDMREHFRFGASLAERHGTEAQDITGGSPISGVVMCLSHSTWETMGGFAEGFFGVDNAAHRSVSKTGRRVYLLPGLYVYHWYRADGVGHSKAPKARVN
jgi:GT2 family glycosyltransferase